MRLSMKKRVLFAIGLMMALPAYAQWDIKIFDRIGRDAIIGILGVPEPDKKYGGWTDEVIPVDYRYSEEYPGTSFVLEKDTFDLRGFNTRSPAFCVLSDYIEGGIKVGDSLSRLQSVDFVHSAYGKNNPDNALRLIDSTRERDYYEVFSKEWSNFCFAVKNDVIISIAMSSHSEDSAIYWGIEMYTKPW